MLLPTTSLRRMLRSHLHSSLHLSRLVTTTVDRVTDIQELCERMNEIYCKTKERNEKKKGGGGDGGGGDGGGGADDDAITGLRPFLLPASFKKNFGSDAGGGSTVKDGSHPRSHPRSRVDLLANCNTESGMNHLLEAMEQCTTATVSVEMGGTNYMDKTMELVDIPVPFFAAYLRLLKEKEEKGEEEEMGEMGEMGEEEEEAEEEEGTPPNIYLAQVDLANTINILQSSRILPLALRCHSSDVVGGGGGGGGGGGSGSGVSLVDESILHADIYAHACWIGPSTTHSPFHVDPHHNCFEQHRGSKLFRLIHPNDAVDVRSFLYFNFIIHLFFTI